MAVLCLAKASRAQIPSTLGWYQIPNAQLSSNCPNDPVIQGTSGCAAVISAWGGGAADAKRNRLLVWGARIPIRW